MGKHGKQGYTYSPGPPRVCLCGKSFVPAVVVERSGGTHKGAYKCPRCTADEKKNKKQKRKG